MLRQWLNLFNIKASLFYRATEHGWNAADFHQRVDDYGPTLTLIKANGRKFGGFTSKSWDSTSECGSDPTSFLFSIDNKQKYPIKYQYMSKATYNEAEVGPSFGEKDLCLGE